MLAVNAKKFFNFKLDGKPVSVPTGFAENVIAFHGLVSGDNILHDTGENVTNVRFAVGGRRTVVEIEMLFAFVEGNALFKDLVVLPKLKDFLFSFNKIEICVNRFVHNCLFCTYVRK